MKEEEIIRLLKEKDEEGMKQLLIHYGPLMKYIISPILPNPRDAEECLSEVTMQIWDKADRFSPQKGSWSAWLTALIRNHAINYRRKLKATYSIEDMSDSVPSCRPGPEERAIRRERQKAVRDALANLSPEDRAIFYRKYYYLQSTNQIASELSMTQRAVEGRLYRIKNKLRNMLGGEGYDMGKHE